MLGLLSLSIGKKQAGYGKEKDMAQANELRKKIDILKKKGWTDERIAKGLGIGAEDVKNLQKKENPIKRFFKKVGTWIKENVRDILKTLLGIGLSAIIFGLFKTILPPNTVVEKAVQYVGISALVFVVEHALGKYVDEEMDDILETKKQFEESMKEIVVNG